MYESGVLLMTMAKQLEFELLLKTWSSEVEGGLSWQISFRAVQ